MTEKKQEGKRGRPSKKKTEDKPKETKSKAEEKPIDEAVQAEKKSDVSLETENYEAVSPFGDDELEHEQVIPKENQINQDLKELGLTKDDLKDIYSDTKAFDPLAADVEQRDYTSGSVTSDSTNFDENEIQDDNGIDFEEPVIAEEHAPFEAISSEPTNEGESFNSLGDSGASGGTDIGGGMFGGSPTGDGKSGGGSAPSNSGGGASAFSMEDDTAFSQMEDEEPQMSEAERKRNAKKTADILLTTYANVFPIPFKLMAKYNEAKLERMEMNGQLDSNMVILNDGTTVGVYVEEHNDECDEIFVITDEQKDEIREPLIDVLMEKGGELSPTNRLLLAVGGQVIAFGTVAFKMMMEKRSALEQFAKFHEEQIAAAGGRRKKPVEPKAKKEPIPKPQATSTKKEEPKVETKTQEDLTMESYLDDDDASIIIEGQPE